MVAHHIAEILDDHVTLEVEAMDRIYLNAYQPQLQTGGGVVAFFKGHRGATVASTTLMAPMSRAFVRQIEQFAKEHDLDIIGFGKGERKDDITPIQNPATFLHPNQTNKTEAGLFTQDCSEIVQGVAGLMYHQPYNIRKLVG